MSNVKSIQPSYERTRRAIVFTAPKELLKTKTIVEIQEDCGFASAAYGLPYDYAENGNMITFKCSSSSD